MPFERLTCFFLLVVDSKTISHLLTDSETLSHLFSYRFKDPLSLFFLQIQGLFFFANTLIFLP